MANPERQNCYILTERDTFVKGFVTCLDDDRIKLEIDTKVHPHLYNRKNFTFTNIFIEYKPEF